MTTLELKSSHIIIPQQLNQEIFGEESHAFLRYYPERKSLLLAPVSQNWFKKMHEAAQFMLKDKNLQGDKSIAIHEILIDNELDEQNKTLSFEIQGNGKILNIHL